MMDWVQQHGTILAAGLAVGYAIKKVPDMLADMAAKRLEAAFAAGDDADDELIASVTLAVVTWTEKKFPQSGTGGQKFGAAAEKLTAIWPWLPKEKIATLIEQSVDRMEARMRAVAAAHKRPI